jgi:hypothetical protein
MDLFINKSATGTTQLIVFMIPLPVVKWMERPFLFCPWTGTLVWVVQLLIHLDNGRWQSWPFTLQTILHMIIQLSLIKKGGYCTQSISSGRRLWEYTELAEISADLKILCWMTVQWLDISSGFEWGILAMWTSGKCPNGFIDGGTNDLSSIAWYAHLF